MRPTKIPIREDGISFLKEVATQEQNTSGFLFHGSPQVIDVLEPRPVYWKDPNDKLYPDSEGPVVCASNKPFIATFMALVPREADWGYISSGKPDALKYYVGSRYREKFLQAAGYVMVLSANGFESLVPPIPAGWEFELPVGGRMPEMRTQKPVKPEYAVRVTYQDFADLLDIQGSSRIDYR